MLHRLTSSFSALDAEWPSRVILPIPLDKASKSSTTVCTEGCHPNLETSAAEAALASAAATIPELRRQIAFQENQIRVLLGENPGPVERPEAALQTESLPEIPAGLPSALLERRPDIRQAEQLMRVPTLTSASPRRTFFPSISLTGLMGETSLELTPFANGAVAAWNATGDLAGPIFRGGLLKGELRQARAAWR